MTKFAVHLFQEVREKYIVEANSIEEAHRTVTENFINLEPVETESTGDYTDYVLVDPLKPNGDVDYEHYRWLDWEGKPAKST